MRGSPRGCPFSLMWARAPSLVLRRQRRLRTSVDARAYITKVYVPDVLRRMPPSFSLELNQIAQKSIRTTTRRREEPSSNRALTFWTKENGSTRHSTASAHTRSGVALRCGVHARLAGCHAARD